MVRLEEVEDEAFTEKPTATKHDELLADDDDDYTDTDSEISDASDLGTTQDESLYDRISALRDIVPPKTRATISGWASSITSATSTGVTYGGKGLWVVATSILLLGLPYALTLGEEQMMQEEIRRANMMQEGTEGIVGSGEGNARASL